MKLSLNDLELMLLSVCSFKDALNKVKDTDKERIKQLEYIEQQLKEEVNTIITTKYEYDI